MQRIPFLLLAAWIQLCAADEYSELVHSEVGVRVLPLNVTIIGNSSYYPNITSDYQPKCFLTVHRKSCTFPPIKLHEKISWSTKMCFQWRCDEEEFALRVGECWIGSQKNPLTIIKSDGCSQESAILRSPSYLSPSRAISVGWLSVREQGMTHVHVQCSLMICHMCEEECRDFTPPRSCGDVMPRNRDVNRVWNNSRVDDLCNPPVIEIFESSASHLLFSSMIALSILNSIL